MKRVHLTLSASKRFKTPEELIDGYELYSKTSKVDTRKVTLIGVALSSGKVSLRLYAYVDGVKKYEPTGVTLEPETSLLIKRDNQEKVRIEREVANQRNSELEIVGSSFSPKKRKRNTNFAEYIRQFSKSRKESEKRGVNSLALHVSIFDSKATLGSIDKEWVEDFITYLREDAINSGNKAKGLAQNTQHQLVAFLTISLNDAVSNGYIESNPVKELKAVDKPKTVDDRRAFLTTEELQKFFSTPYEGRGCKDVPKAFLFSCFTGLRYSDVRKLSPSDLFKDDLGTYIKFQVTKTKRVQKLYLSDIAQSYLPEGAKGDKPYFTLSVETNTNRLLRRWSKQVGVDKYITFHVARHTCATMMLNNGVPIEVVSNQLGHRSIATTQIYAKVTNKSQLTASSIFDKLYNK